MVTVETRNVRVTEIRPNPDNPRTISRENMERLVRSLREFPEMMELREIVVDETMMVLGGNMRLRALKEIGEKTCMAKIVTGLSDEQKREFVIKDNAGFGEWDWDCLADGWADIPLNEWGVDIPDDWATGNKSCEGLTDEDAVPEVEENPVSVPGDIWILGDHRVMCGDSTDAGTVAHLIDGGKADMAFTDPPYNVDYGNTMKDNIRYHSTGRKRLIMNDNLGDGFGAFLSTACANLLKHTEGAVYICMSSSELDTLQSAFRGAGGHWSTFIIWAKNTFTLGRSDYQGQYEPILYGWSETGKRHWCGDRDQADVWFVNKPIKNDLHPTMKPVELIERAITNSSKKRGVVLDLFGGSGSTLIACEKTSRACRMLELDPRYVDVIIRRWQGFTGKQAVGERDGKLFDNRENILAEVG